MAYYNYLKPTQYITVQELHIKDLSSLYYAVNNDNTTYPKL